MKQTLTKSQIQKKAKALEKRLNNLYNDLDFLMDEADIVSSEMGYPETDAARYKQSDFDAMSHLLGKARDFCGMGLVELESVKFCG